jgi:mRNA interferase RelE/StbE
LDRYRVFETETFQEDLAQIGRSGLTKIAEKLREHVYPQLRTEPHHGPNIKRLKNWSPPTWRCRIGAWRFFYEIDETDKIVYMTAADHRSRSYR